MGEYDQILLIPKSSSVRSRLEIDTSISVGGLNLGLPLLVSPMDSFYSTVEQGRGFLSLLSESGILGFVHRFWKKQDRLELIYRLSEQQLNFGVAVGLLENDELEIFKAASNSWAAIICIDVANGHNEWTLESVRRAQSEKKNSRQLIMAGNVASFVGYQDMARAGADLVRVGIGTGAACTTRQMTGVGYPQVALLSKIDQHRRMEKIGAKVVADGGIKYPGDILKALALGADVVMAGWLLSGAAESGNGTYRGLASRQVQEDHYGFVRSVEGIEIAARSQGEPIKDIVAGIKSNLQSGMAYIGASKIEDIHRVARFIDA